MGLFLISPCMQSEQRWSLLPHPTIFGTICILMYISLVNSAL